MSIATEYNWESIGCIVDEFTAVIFSKRLYKRFIVAQAKDYGRLACSSIGEEPSEKNDKIIKELNSAFYTSLDLFFNGENTIEVEDEEAFNELTCQLADLWYLYLVPVKERKFVVVRKIKKHGGIN